MDVGAPREEAREGARHHDRGGPAGDEAVDPEDRRDRAAAEQAIDAEHPHVERGALRDRGAADRVGEGVGRVRLPAESPAAVDPQTEVVGPPEHEARAEDAAAAHAPDGAARVPVDEAPDGAVELEAELVAERGVLGVVARVVSADRGVLGVGAGVLLDVVPLTGFDAARELLLGGDDRPQDAQHEQIARARLPVGDVEAAVAGLHRVGADAVALSHPLADHVVRDDDGRARVEAGHRLAHADVGVLVRRDRAQRLVAVDELPVAHPPAVGPAGRGARAGHRDRLPGVDRDVVAVDRRSADLRPLVRGVAVGFGNGGAERGGGRVGRGREALVAVAAGVRRVAAVEVRNQLRAGGARDQHGGEKGDTEGRAEHHGREPLSGGGDGTR